MSAWWEDRERVLEQLRADGRERGCSCGSDPWCVSEPGDRPIYARIMHSSFCQLTRISVAEMN